MTHDGNNAWRALRETTSRSMAFFCLDEQRVVTGADPAVARLFGCAVEDIVGRSFDALVDPKNRAGQAAYGDALTRVNGDGFCVRASLRIGADTTHTWIAMSRVRRGWSVMLTPINPSDESFALLAGRERWRALTRTATDGIAIVAPDGGLLEHNPRFLELMHFESRHGVSLTGAAISRRKLAELLHGLPFGGVVAGLAEKRARRRRFHGRVSHRSRELDVTLTPVMLPGAGYVGGCLVLRDVTDELLLRRAQIDRARAVGRAELAVAVMHDIGNGLNGVNVSRTTLHTLMQGAPTKLLAKIADLIQAHQDDLPAFFGEDPRGRRIPATLRRVCDSFDQLQRHMETELADLGARVEHLNRTVAAQRNGATHQEIREAVRPKDLMSAAVQCVAADLPPAVELRSAHRYDEAVYVDRGKVVRILVELLNNAIEALNGAGTVELSAHVLDEHLHIEVADDGVGIGENDVELVFTSGYSTKPGRNGFGLHDASNAAGELGGSLRFEVTERGAKFMLAIPVMEAPAASQRGATPTRYDLMRRGDYGSESSTASESAARMPLSDAVPSPARS